MDGLRPGTIELNGASLDLSYPSIVPPEERNNVLEISNLLTQYANRRQNRASALLQDVCEQADHEGKCLLVLVGAFDTGGPSNEQLTEWYTSKFGFTALQLDPQPLLIRMPLSAVQQWAATNAR